MARRTVSIAVVLGTLAALAGCAGHAEQPGSNSVVPRAIARRIAAIWGGSVTYLPTWAPRGVVPTDWGSGTCACGTDDNLLVVRFARGAARLEWEVSDPREIDRVKAGIVCQGARTAVVDGRAVYYRRKGDTDTAWMCIDVSGEWGPRFHVQRLTISLKQGAGDDGRLRASELEQMVANARSSPPGRAPGLRYELPSHGEIRRMAVAFREPLLVPTRLPDGFIFSDWLVTAARPRQGFHRRHLALVFGRNGLFSQIAWDVASGIDTLGLECPTWGMHLRPTSLQHQVVIGGRTIYAVEGIHGVSVWTCLPADVVGNAQPLEVSLWYDIRLHSPAMLHLAERMIRTARLLDG